jgi:hypothetical protein
MAAREIEAELKSEIWGTVQFGPDMMPEARMQMAERLIADHSQATSDTSPVTRWVQSVIAEVGPAKAVQKISEGLHDIAEIKGLGKDVRVDYTEEELKEKQLKAAENATHKPYQGKPRIHRQSMGSFR